MKPLLIMLAGPNGAGKSTFYSAYLSHLDLPFLNADNHVLAFRMDAYDAADEVARLRDRLIDQNLGFITETVFSDPIGAKVDVLAGASSKGYDVELIYIGLRNPELSRTRVRERIQAGGHAVPESKLSARYARSLINLGRAIERLPRVRLFDNSTYETPFRFVAEFRNGALHQSGAKPVPLWAKPFIRQVRPD